MIKLVLPGVVFEVLNVIAWFCVFLGTIYAINTEKSENVKLAASPQFIFSNHLRIRRYSALNKYLPSLDRCQPSIKCLHFEPAINIVAVYKWAPEKKVAPERKSRARKKNSRARKKVAPNKKSRAKKKKSRQREKIASAKKDAPGNKKLRQR